MANNDSYSAVRLDKWLWAARFFRTRSLAAGEIARGRVQVNGQVAKASREVRTGDRIEMHQGAWPSRVVSVSAVSLQRGSATVASALFAEDEASIRAREAAIAKRRSAPEPAAAIEAGRPTKRNRRQLADWQRWSAIAESD